MEEVVYITGAGFSAVAGLPVMSNFLEKAKDIYLRNPEEYEHFQQVIDYINDLSFIKNYYKSDLHNIEEILSIIEMGESVGGRDEVGFKQLINDTIKYYTPENPLVDDLQINQMNFLGENRFYQHLGAFILSLTNTSYKPRRVGVDRVGIARNHRYDIEFFANERINNTYSIITLNYDRIVESIFDYIEEHESLDLRTENLFFRDNGGIDLYKLHGSIDSEIIPPTWNKILNEHVQESWEGAYRALKSAKHIRILGYSLPKSDSYIKYLFKAAIAENKYLKTIDIICLDPDGSVEDRYRNFITYHKLKFRNADLGRYLHSFYEPLREPHIDDMFRRAQTKQLSNCENIHDDFMRN